MACWPSVLARKFTNAWASSRLFAGGEHAGAETLTKAPGSWSPKKCSSELSLFSRTPSGLGTSSSGR